MNDKNYKKRVRTYGPTVCPHVTFNCANSIEKVLEYACGQTKIEPADRDYDIVEAFLKNLKIEISDRKMLYKKRKNAAKTGARNVALKALIQEQTEDMAETGH